MSQKKIRRIEKPSGYDIRKKQRAELKARIEKLAEAKQKQDEAKNNEPV